MSILNSFTSGETISSDDVDANFSDIASELTNSVAKDGQTTMTGQLKAASGTSSLPGITFGSDTDSGFYRKASDTIGISAGGAEVATLGTSGFVDSNSNTIVGIPSGAMQMYVGTSAPTGWVRANGRTIGDGSSGGTERANADTSTLFSVLWSAYANAQLAIEDSSGVASTRGADAATDYAAHKRLPLPDLRGRGFFGLDDMGNSAASRLGTIITSQTTNGASGGTETHALTEAQLPAHTHGLNSHTHSFSATSGTESQNHTHSGTTSTDGSHNHDYEEATFTGLNVSAGGTNVATALDTETSTTGGAHTHSMTTGNPSATHTHSVSGTTGTPSASVTTSTGSSSAHSNMPPAWLGTFIIKL
jgi:microcystin-dependent protein